jgi:hypothetical protein
MLIKSHLLSLAIGIASIAPALTCADAHGFGGAGGHVGGMSVHVPSASAFTGAHVGPSIARLPASHALKLGPTTSIKPSKLLVPSSKLGKLPGSVTHTASLDKVQLPAGSFPKPTNPSTNPGGVANAGNHKLQLPAQQAGATPNNPTIMDKAREVAAQQAAATPNNPTIMDKAREVAQQAAATPNNPTIMDKAREVAQQAAATTPNNPTIMDKARQVAAAATNTGNPILKLPAGSIPKPSLPPPPPPPPPPLPPGMPHHPGGGYGGGVVVVAPDVPVGVPVVTGPVAAPIVQVPVAAPSITVARTPRTAVARQQAVQQDASCGVPQVPRLAAMLDELLSSAQFDADLDTVKALRLAIADLDAAGQRKAARTVEERAMAMLGYAKFSFRCGDGSFAWTKQTAAVE